MTRQIPCPRRRGAAHGRGFAAIYTVIALIALCAIASLAVDYGRVQLAKVQLQTAADAAVRAAATGLVSSAAQARQNAADIAAANRCDGTSVVLDTTADVEFGTWDQASHTFTTIASGSEDDATAIRITARRCASRGTAIPLSLAQVIGRSTCDIKAMAIATVSAGSQPTGFVGLNSVTLKNGALVASYNSSWQSHPNQFGAFMHGMVGSNGVVGFGNGGLVMGSISVGPAGSVSGNPLVTGGTSRLSSPLGAPPSPGWTPAPNPNNVPQNYTVNSNTTLPGGTYWFTSLNVQAPLSFSGPATVYVNGNVTVDSSINPTSWKPPDLKIYQLGDSRSFGDDNSGMVVCAQVQAPGADFTAKNSLLLLGSATFKTLTAKNGAVLFYDEAAAQSGGGGTTTIAVVQ